MRPQAAPFTRLRRARPRAAAQLRAAHTAATPGLRSFPAWFVRGGTSNGLIIRSADLPASSAWPAILAPAMGSPDPVHARQLDGMGSGVSSTSKLVVLSPTTTTTTTTTAAAAAAHVAYTFVQVGIRDGVIDTAGNCGNMSSVVGPAAWDMGYVAAEDKPGLVSTMADGTRWATMRLFNMNTQKVVEATFRVDDGPEMAYCPAGEYVMDGVPGAQSPVTMSFLDPAGAKAGRGALPTGRPVDELCLPDRTTVPASLVDVGNPGVFILGRALGLETPPAPADIEADAELKVRLDSLRRQGASMMGLDPNTESVPKVVMLFPPAAGSDVDICCRAMSMGQAHKAVPLTLALCLGAAARTEGTLAWEVLRKAGRQAMDGAAVRIAHPSGLVDVDTTVVEGQIKAAKLLRTARVLMKGEVYY